MQPENAAADKCVTLFKSQYKAFSRKDVPYYLKMSNRHRGLCNDRTCGSIELGLDQDSIMLRREGERHE